VIGREARDNPSSLYIGLAILMRSKYFKGTRNLYDKIEHGTAFM
jgi:hypothetical protein